MFIKFLVKIAMPRM